MVSDWHTEGAWEISVDQLSAVSFLPFNIHVTVRLINIIVRGGEMAGRGLTHSRRSINAIIIITLSEAMKVF